jgi:hypothetical protein
MHWLIDSLRGELPSPYLEFVLVRVVLAGVRRWEIRHLGGLKSAIVEIVFDPDHGKTQIRFDGVRETFHASGPLVVQPMSGEGTMRGRLDLQLPRRHLHELLGAVVDIPAVHEIRELPSENS